MRVIRHALRALCATALATAPLAMTATPAHAIDLCTVNGVPQIGTAINGTAGNDVIHCAEILGGDTINGHGGNDTITIDGSVRAGGSVAGGNGDDHIVVTGSVLEGGSVTGGKGNDHLVIEGGVMGRTGTSAPGGRVDAGPGKDIIETPNVGSKGEAAVVLGGEGDDTLRGFDGDAATKHDLMTVGPHAATADGGPGTDRCDTTNVRKAKTVHCEF